jgi:hypothetical protein
MLFCLENDNCNIPLVLFLRRLKFARIFHYVQPSLLAGWKINTSTVLLLPHYIQNNLLSKYYAIDILTKFIMHA